MPRRVLERTGRFGLTPIQTLTLCCTLLFLLALGFPVVVQAQNGRVRGTVHDPSGAGIPAASVELHANTYERMTTTDTEGNFTFDSVPEDSGTVSVSLTGFETETLTWTPRAATSYAWISF